MRLFLGMATLVFSATTAASLPLPGGGPAETDCHAEFASTRMKLNFPPFNPAAPAPREEVRCFDGDPGCDLDGQPDGTCTFDINVCLRNADPDLPECTPQDVEAATASEVTSKTAIPLDMLNDALSELLPATATACTQGQVLSIAAPKGLGQVRIRVAATTSDAVTDTDELTLTCVPHGWPSHGFNYGNHRSNPMEESIDTSNAGALGIKWRFSVDQFDGSGSVTSTPVVGNGMVYITSWNSKIYALNRETGELVWDYRSPFSSFLGVEGSPTLTADGRVLLLADKTVECLDARDGTPLWATQVSDAPESEMWGAAIVANGRVFVGVASAADSPCASDGQIAALDLDTGDVLWRYVTTAEMICASDTAVECSDAGDCPLGGECVIARGGGVTARPAVSPDGETVFANTVGCFTFPSNGDSDSILAFDAATGDLRWKNRVQPPEQFAICRQDGGAECRNDADCAVGTCAPKGAFHDFGFLNGPLYVDASETGIGKALVVSGSKDGTLYALDAETGSIVWTNEVVPTPVSPGFAVWGLFNGAIAYSAGHIFAGLHDVGPRLDPDHLRAFRITDGVAAWVQPFEHTWGDSSVANGIMFIGDCGRNSTCNPDCNSEECPVGTFYAVDASDGRFLKRFSTPEGVAGGAAIVDGVVYAPYGVTSAVGGVTAYAIACPGDCNLDGTVDISELTRGVGESLGLPDVAECGIFDRDGNGLSIDELVRAVLAALNGCASFGF